ncbi:MarR family transcriptional regulator [Fulvimarina sp. 2208YS6-2-32]|uniref:MarR family transcriptional regulator n=1 Tax=Fulvimarina uroteuthidis TaxID=3098149 RepID=A0ABU5I0S3_9HYPH|nr:MarR family transcriptional regulator [Fulvimarina sp. 2208YS6-2-32]MDY8108989.1 MarR family transcriptional regulator [Fulvimarina sp. 2208YS6-2-32]
MTFATSQQITLALLDVSRLLRDAFEDAYRDMKITWPQIRIIRRLYIEEGVGQSEVGTQIEMDAMTISRQIDKLVDLGFVERRMEAGDRRLRRLYLTNHSRGLREEMETRMEGVLQGALQSLDEAQQDAFLAMLNAVAGDLSAKTAATSSKHRSKNANADQAMMAE